MLSSAYKIRNNFVLKDEIYSKSMVVFVQYLCINDNGFAHSTNEFSQLYLCLQMRIFLDEGPFMSASLFIRQVFSNLQVYLDADTWSCGLY